MDQVRQVLRYHHYAYRTEQTYCDWIKRYIRYHDGKTHPRNIGKKEIEAFLSHLALQKNVAAATQRQALNAIVFLMAKLLYGSGLRLMECVRLRVRDKDISVVRSPLETLTRP